MLYVRQSKYLDVVIEVSPAISGCLEELVDAAANTWLLVIRNKKGGLCPLADPIGI